MKGFILLIPFLLVRFLLLSKLSSDAISRAAHFAPMQGNERIAYWAYQILNVVIFVYLCFIRVSVNTISLFILGLFKYLIGLLICTISVICFASSSEAGLNTNGIYKYSRNPMYVSYFLVFIGCSLLTNSWILFTMTLVFQISSHWIILSEERWCINEFTQSYQDYMLKVRRYL